MSNAKIHGVLTGSSGQDPKADHGTAIGSREASDPDALRSGRVAPGGRRCLRTRSCANAARRALRWCSPSRSGRPRSRHARPVAADRSHPRWRSLPQRPHERAEDHGRYTLTPPDIPLPLTGSRNRTATGGRRQLTCRHWEGGSPLGASRVPDQLRNPPQFVVHRCNRIGLLQGSAAAALIYMTRTRHARRRS